MDKLSILIKELRQKNNYTQKSFSEKIGISQGALSDIESGKSKPALDTVIAICKEFDVSSDWLLFNEEKHSSLSENEKIILDMYRALSNTDKIKIEGIMEEKLKEE